MRGMIRETLLGLACIAVASICSPAWALDEAVLTPTNDSVRPAEEQAFNSAMDVWFAHRYADGEKLLAEFATKCPDSRWRAEAELHRGCYLTYLNQLDDARAIFNKVIEAHPKDVAATKAKLRLGNIAERVGNFDEALTHYTEALSLNPTWDQFKYANYNARKHISRTAHTGITRGI